MALTEEMSENDYHKVLTGKWNQDVIEVNSVPLFIILESILIYSLQRMF